MSKANMTYRRLGSSGLKLSALSIGGWTTFGGSVTEHETVSTILKAAREAGINFFDIADVYARGESEKAMGRVLKEFPRHELVISTKVYWPMSDDVNDRGLSRKHIMESIDRSLERIGTDYLDLYFCHRPDPDTPIEETVRAMDDLVHRGKVLYWGTSEWTGEQIAEAWGHAERRNLYGPQVEQPQLSLLVREKFETDTRPAAEARGMGLVTWSPLASGVLSGKYADGLPEDSRLARIDWLRDQYMTVTISERVRELKALADELGSSPAQLALAWTLARPGVTSVITGATRAEQLEDNLMALEVKLTDELTARLEAIFPRS